jgi:hypothetical protein
MSERLKGLKVKLKAAMLDRRLKMRQLNSVRKAYDRAARLVDELEQKIEIELAKPERKHKQL